MTAATLQTLTLPAFAQMLEALSTQLDKAAAHADANGGDIEAMMAARLAPDMFPLSMQVQFSCVQAIEARARLLDAAIGAVSPVETFADAKERLAQTIELLRGAPATENENGDRAIALDLPNGMGFDLTLAEYVRSWALPQFYFHLVCSYAIMRHNGVDLGKPDYVPHMFKFLRK
ncbi:MAG: DUF1993 domain-containing protein [Parvularculaceae bacterium]